MMRTTVVLTLWWLTVPFVVFAQKSERVAFPEGFVLVEAGSFQMGSELSPEEIAYKYGGEAAMYETERPVHQVTISRSFYMSRYEVTQKQWRDVMGTDTDMECCLSVEVFIGFDPERFKGENRPVTHVSWYDAVKYCNTLSGKEGLTPCYSESGENIRCNFSANGYRLPTEAEWEYAARGGNKSRGYIFAGSNLPGEVGWYVNNSDSRTHDVGQKKSNELGLYDMSGNMFEWCWDWHHSYGTSSQIDPSGPSNGSSRVYRGGSWISGPQHLRSDYRFSYHPSFTYSFISFRLVRTVE